LAKILSKLISSDIDHFFAISKELFRISHGQSIDLIDIGSGSAHYWKSGPLFEFLKTTNSRLILLDANSDSQHELPHCNLEVMKIVGQAPSALTKLDENSVHVALALDVIEHLSKEDGYRLLYEMDRISRKSVIIFTPNGFVWQSPSDNNEFNAHISSWTPREFRELGWDQISGHVGPKMVFGPYAELSTRKLTHLYKAYRRMINVIIFHKPNYAFSFLAILQHKLPRNKQQQL